MARHHPMWRGEYVELSQRLVKAQENEANVTVFVMALIKGQNNFHYESVAEWNKALDLVEGEVKRVAALERDLQVGLTRMALIVHGTGKYFSTGLDLHALYARPNPSGFLANHYHPLLARILCLPIVTVAAINGHVYAGGMAAAMAFDWRVMVEDPSGRFKWCMNEIELASPIPRGMAVLLAEKWSRPPQLRDCLLTAKRYTAGEALEQGLVDRLCSGDLIPEAMAFAAQQAKPAVLHTIIRMMKEEAWPRSTAILRNPDQTDYFAHHRRYKL